MHYTEADLYFRLKKDADEKKMREIPGHLDTCPACRKAAEKVKSINAAFGASLLEPPAYNPISYVKRHAAAPTGQFLSLRVAAAVTTAAAAALFVFMYAGIKEAGRNNNASAFVYSTYKTLYDFDYYYNNCVKNTDLLQTAEVKK